MSIDPTIGRVVWLKDSNISDQMMSAQISYVWNDELVNLGAFDSNGDHFSKTSVPLFQGDADKCPEGSCCWMPYQKKTS